MHRYLLAALFLMFLAGCGSNDVVLDYSIIKIEGPLIKIVGKTNLPPGTILELNVYELIPEGFPQAEDGQRGIERCDEIEDPDERFICRDMHEMYGYFGGEGGIVADDGSFNFSDYGPDNGFEEGEYQIQVGVSWPKYQPDNIKELIGDRGEKLSGPLVRKNSSEFESDQEYMVFRIKKFQIGDEEGLIAQRKRFQETIKKSHIWIGIVETMKDKVPEARELRYQKEKEIGFFKSFDEEMEKHLEKAEILGPEINRNFSSRLKVERKLFERIANETQSEFERTKGHYQHWLKQLKEQTAGYEKYYQSRYNDSYLKEF